MDRRDPRPVTGQTPIALTIAGSDSGGGAGIQADLKTFAALGVYGASAITALTAQNTKGVRAIHLAPPAIVAAEIEAVFEDFAVAAIKIGMLGGGEVARVVAKALRAPSPQPSPASGRGGETLLPLAGEGGGALAAPDEGRTRAFIVYDPVMAASSGDPMSGPNMITAIKAELMPLVDCLTPNFAEAARLLGEPPATSEAQMTDQGCALLELGPRAVVMKGGHLQGDEVVDLLVTPDAVHRFAAPRIGSSNLHGTGCTLSSAIAAYLVLGKPLGEAVASAKAFVREGIARGRSVKLGAGSGPLLQTPLKTR
ncbi:MAG: hydroxymethylpyrimidine/phosphomethylpyrimidine kinase [Hyphomicrobiales bacterium]|nr:hydroxymethylpyrimidine/phosphomethylpyrimidine kinase [Hyphomicrobiales bacterium]